MSGQGRAAVDSERWEPVAAVLLSVGLVVPLLTAGFVPTHDGLQHLLHGYLWNHLHDPGRTYDVFLERGHPITAWGFTWVFAPLERVLDWRAAYQASLSAIALGSALAFRAVVRSVAGRRTPLGLLGFAVAMGWPVYMGFLAFVAAAALGLGVVAFAARRPVLRAVDWFVVSGGLLVVAMMHSVGAAFCGLVLLALRLGAVPSGRIPETVRCALAGIPAVAVAYATVAAGGEALTSLGGETQLLWHPLGHRIADLADAGIGGPRWRSVPVVACAVLGTVTALGGLRQRAATGGEAPPGSNSLADAASAGAAVAFLLALALPFHTTSWEYLAPRPLLFAIILGTAALAARVPRRVDGLALPVVVLFATASLVWSAGHDRALARSAAEATAALDTPDPVERRGWVLPIVYDVYGEPGPNAVAYTKPLANIGNVYVIEQGGMTPYLFASAATIHQHVVRTDITGPRVPDRSYFDTPVRPEMVADPRRLDAVRTGVLSAAPDYEAVIAWGDPPTIELMRERGFDLEHDDERLAVGRFRGCPFDLTIRGPVDAEVGGVQTGWFPLTEGGRDALVTPLGTGVWNARAATAPCGDVWVRIDATGPDGPLHCRGADERGLVLPVEPGFGPVLCDLE